MKALKLSVLVMVAVGFFTYLLLQGHISEAGYIALLVVIAICTMALYFSDRVKEVSLLNKAVIKLYQKSREGLTVDKLALEVGKILTRLSAEATGSAKQRREREVMIEGLLKSAKASKAEREKILADAKLITKMMATEDGAELEKLKEEIEKRGLFD